MLMASRYRSKGLRTPSEEKRKRLAVVRRWASIGEVGSGHQICELIAFLQLGNLKDYKAV